MIVVSTDSKIDNKSKNDINIIYSVDFFETIDEMDYNVINFYPAGNNLVVIRKDQNNQTSLNLAYYEDSEFIYRIININTKVNDITAIILLSENISSKIFYVIFKEKTYGDLYVTCDHDSIWTLSIENVINSLYMNEFFIDFHKV